jgi:hypothetical protein
MIRANDALIDQEIDPDSDVYDDELRDKDEPVDKAPAEEIDPDSTKVDLDQEEDVYEDEAEHQREPL